MRKLLSSGQVAEKLGHSRAWLYKKRRALEKQGFPAPVLTGRWDEAAIDRWLDQRMSDGLRAPAEISRDHARDFDALLARRLASV